MANLGMRFNAQDHDTEQRDFSELPNGIYELEIEASELVEKDDGARLTLKTTMSVLRPQQYERRKLFTTFNLKNPSVQAEEIGNRQFASLCRALGLQEVEDTDELHLRAFTAKIGLGKPSSDGKYPARAEIKTYYFPDTGNVPEPKVDEAPAQQRPAARQAANNNQPAAANDNRGWGGGQQRQAATGGARTPWGGAKPAVQDDDIPF